MKAVYSIPEGEVAISEEKIARARIKSIPIDHPDPLKVKGSNIFSDINANIYLVSRKKSGKTWVIGTILDKCADKDTIIYLFASTHLKDPAWLHIKQSLASRGIQVVPFTEIKDGKTDHLKDIVKKMSEEVEEDNEPAPPGYESKAAAASALLRSISRLINVDDGRRQSILPIRTGDEIVEPEVEKKARKKRKIAPRYIFVFDDMADQLKNITVSTLLKKNRHYKCKVIISTQYLNDTKPEARRNMDYWILFRGIPEDKLKIIIRDADIAMSIEEFSTLYYHATQQKYNFLFIDCVNDQFRHNFDKLLSVAVRRIE